MREKVIFQGFVLAAVFAAVFFVFSLPDYMELFHVRENTESTEKKMGDLLWKGISNTENVVENDSVNDLVDKLIKRIAEKNDIDLKSLKVHVIEKEEVNAFAMPNNYLILYSGLINDCADENELAGVLCHEIAHIEKDHVMKKLVKEIGLSALISVTTGNRSPQIIKEAAHLLSSSEYDRELESEADRVGVDYMIKADLDPNKLADFLYRLATTENLPEQVYWVSTHPESKARAKAVIEYAKEYKVVKKPVFSKEEWNYLKNTMRIKSQN